MLNKIVLTLIFIAGLGGCGSAEIQDYKNEKPVLDLQTYFNGRIDGWGMFQDRSGKVVKRFHVLIDAKWVGNTGTLDEDFTYSDGTKQKRVWTITRLDNNHYRGTAADVVGEAIGEAYGNALRWKYVLDLPVDGKNYHVDFDDWMYLQDDKVLLNRSFMTKFGFALGELTLSFTKR